MYTNINSLKLKIVVKKFSIMCDGRDNTKKLYNYFHYGPLKKTAVGYIDIKKQETYEKLKNIL